jgi:hypothetical protein
MICLAEADERIVSRLIGGILEAFWLASEGGKEATIRELRDRLSACVSPAEEEAARAALDFLEAVRARGLRPRAQALS